MKHLLTRAACAVFACGFSLSAMAGTSTVPQLPGSSGTVTMSGTSVKAAFPSQGFVGLNNRLLELPGAKRNDKEGYVTVPVQLADGRQVLVTLDSSGGMVNVEPLKQ